MIVYKQSWIKTVISLFNLCLFGVGCASSSLDATWNCIFAFFFVLFLFFLLVSFKIWFTFVDGVMVDTLVETVESSSDPGVEEKFYRASDSLSTISFDSLTCKSYTAGPSTIMNFLCDILNKSMKSFHVFRCFGIRDHSIKVWVYFSLFFVCTIL